jgi:hypothetical protein
VLTFDEHTHTYRYSGVKVPSVTQVLEPLFDWSAVPVHILDRKKAIGRAVHAAIHYELSGGVDENTIDPACRPYWEAWKRFRDETKFEPWLVEYRVHSDEIVDASTGEVLCYAGTLDEYGTLNLGEALIDWKCSLFLNHEAVGSQTAAYLKALHRDGIASRRARRYALQLSSEGGYKLKEFTDLHDDWQRFVSYRRKHVTT